MTVVQLRLTFWHLNDSCTNTAHTFWQLSDRMTVVHLQLTVSCTSGSRPCLTTRPSCGYNGPIQVDLWPSGPYLIDCKYLWGLYTGPSSPPPPPSLLYTLTKGGQRSKVISYVWDLDQDCCIRCSGLESRSVSELFRIGIKTVVIAAQEWDQDCCNNCSGLESRLL